MRAIVQTAVAAAALMLMPSVPAQATEACDQIGRLSSAKVAEHLRLFSGPILGKDASRWTLRDFNNLLTNVAACEGRKGADGHPVKTASWQFQMRKAAERVLPVSALLDGVDARFGRPAADLPECVALLEWKHDRKAHANNAAKVFGREFRGMDPAAARLAASYAGACQPAMEAVLKARGYGSDVAGRIVADIGKAAASEIAAGAEDRAPRHPQHLAPTADGRVVPLAYLGERARRMVDDANLQAETPGPVSADRATALVNWADETIEAGADDAEMAYARAVKELVSGRLFGR